MQPTLVLTAPHPGILYINGSFAGEIGSDAALMRPVAGRGPVYLDYRPLSCACGGMARRLVFSGGAPIAESADSAGNMEIVIWPGGVVEIELLPPEQATPPRSISMAGHSFLLDGNELRCDGRMIGRLPEGASLPECSILPEGAVLSGSFPGGRYLLACDAGFTRQTGFLQAQQLEIEPDGRIRAIAASGDLVGHARLENWRLSHDGLMLISSENVWAHGAPHWPQTPAETARAAMEALLAGLDAEAEGYLSPSLRSYSGMHTLKELGDLCVEMKYTPPDPRPCVGMLQLEGEHLARVRPLYYRASAAGGPQGPWQIEDFQWT